MVEYTLYYPPYPLWGYEADLARREVHALTGISPEQIQGGLRITSPHAIELGPLRRLTFCHRIEVRNGHGPEDFLTYQAVIENTSKLGRTASQPHDVQPLLGSLNQVLKGRKESRYVTHGVHEYKGKFYPQLAKALLTYLGARDGQVVLDPFGGSGTTLLECHLANIVGISVDLNPLACMVAEAKLGCLSMSAAVVVQETEHLLGRVQKASAETESRDAALGPLFAQSEPPSSGQPQGGTDVNTEALLDRFRAMAPLPYSDAELQHLISWFAPRVLEKLFRLLSEIQRVPQPPLRRLCEVLLSDILRDCSQQEPRDLRIRRRQPHLVDAPVFTLFSGRLLDVANRLTAFLWSRDGCGVRGTEWECYAGDARALHNLPSKYLARAESVDVVLTSPPYATALPYLDTQRLSLAFLRLTGGVAWQTLDKEMIGNREIPPAMRVKLEREFLQGYDECPLPAQVKAVILDVYERNASAEVGFRRKNMAALLYQYFSDMRQVMNEAHRVLKPGGRFALVVGNNVTTAGGERIDIETDVYLGLIGRELGFGLLENLPITVTTEDLAHSKNAIRENTVIILEKAAKP